MQRKCEKCGEVLYGAVNRCWKCGTTIEIVVKPTLPPIRRSPVELVRYQATGANVGAAIASAKQILPWFLNVDLSETARHRCAGISTAVGVIGCLIGIASSWSLIFGATGIVFGLVGMPAKRRDLATMGLVLSVIALFLGFGQIGFDVWTKYASRRWIEDLQGLR